MLFHFLFSSTVTSYLIATFRAFLGFLCSTFWYNSTAAGQGWLSHSGWLGETVLLSTLLRLTMVLHEIGVNNVRVFSYTH